MDRLKRLEAEGKLGKKSGSRFWRKMANNHLAMFGLVDLCHYSRPVSARLWSRTTTRTPSTWGNCSNRPHGTIYSVRTRSADVFARVLYGGRIFDSGRTGKRAGRCIDRRLARRLGRVQGRNRRCVSSVARVGNLYGISADHSGTAAGERHGPKPHQSAHHFHVNRMGQHVSPDTGQNPVLA